MNTPERSNRFVVKREPDPTMQNHGSVVYMVCDTCDGRIVKRTYSKRDAQCEARYRNKWNPDGDMSGTSRNIV